MITDADYLIMKKYLSVLGDLAPSERVRWQQCALPVQYEQGVNIGSNTADMILLKSGMLRMFLLSDEGRELTLYRLRAGDAYVQSMMNYNVQIEAEEHCEAFVMNAEDFGSFYKSNKDVQIYFGRLLTERFSMSLEILMQLMSMTLEERLALFLCNELKSAPAFCIELTHDQIARHIGSTREMVTRILNTFSDAGAVVLSRGRVEVVNQNWLEKLIG